MDAGAGVRMWRSHGRSHGRSHSVRMVRGAFARLRVGKCVVYKWDSGTVSYP